MRTPIVGGNFQDFGFSQELLIKYPQYPDAINKKVDICKILTSGLTTIQFKSDETFAQQSVF